MQLEIKLFYNEPFFLKKKAARLKSSWREIAYLSAYRHAYAFAWGPTGGNMRNAFKMWFVFIFPLQNQA